ncbi:MAG TPA: cytochrome P450 [Sporichthyaceae bacterium]|nr:cytochrome P450 [Sporichthyaceae bacterium]
MTAASQMPDILSPEFAQDPQPYYKIMRDHYPLLHHEASGYYFISRFEDVARAYRDSEAFSNVNYGFQMEPVIGRTLIQMGGHEHAVNRALVTPTLRGKYLESFSPQVQSNADAMIDKFRGRGEVELIEEFTKWYPINVVVDMLDLPREDMPIFHNWYSSLMAFLSNLTRDPDIHEWGMRTQKEFPEYILPVIAQRRRNPGDDLISRLTQAETDGESMTDERIKALIGLLFIAGGETTDKAIANCVRHLLDNPEQLAELRADPSLATDAIAESLRYAPPVQIILRTAVNDIEVAGGIIPGGSTVACVNGAANRDERRFIDPDVWNMHRTDLTVEQAFTGAADHIAFALGRHFCVGSLLAKREMEIAIVRLFEAMPDVRWADGFTPVDVGLFTRAPQALRLQFTPAA